MWGSPDLYSRPVLTLPIKSPSTGIGLNNARVQPISGPHRQGRRPSPPVDTRNREMPVIRGRHILVLLMVVEGRLGKMNAANRHTGRIMQSIFCVAAATIGVRREETEASRAGELKMDWTKPLQGAWALVLIGESETAQGEQAIDNDGRGLGGVRLGVFSGPAKDKVWSPWLTM